MFWGMNLKPNRKYSQTTSKSFHISQAALDPECADETVNKIYISSEDNQKYLVCTLRKNICEQVQLDLNFVEGDTICFQTIGSGLVSLTGYLTNLDYEDEEDSDMNLEINDHLQLNGNATKKTKKEQKKNESKDEEESSDDDGDDSALLNAALESDDDDEDEEDDNEEDSESDEEDEDDDDDEEEEDVDDDDEEEIQEPKKKIAKIEKKDNKQQKQQQKNGEVKTKKEKKAEKQQQQKTPQQKSGGERTLSGGVKVEDIRVGNGEEIKNGKRAQVYYEGRLKSNNKVFDSLKSGTPFKFTVGRGEVIKGWDIGVAGMKIGGKRRIICPPHMAYGARGSPSTIPPNSTLVFEVELKSVSK